MEFRLSAHSIDVRANGSKGNYYAQAKSSISNPVYSGSSASVPRGLRRVRHNGQSRTHEFFSFPNFLVCWWSRLHTDSEWHRVYRGFDGAMERIESQTMFVAATQLTATIMAAAWIGGQALYWLFLRHQTEFFGDEYWRMFLLISRNRTTEDITR